jgi:transposase, IS5 family
MVGRLHRQSSLFYVAFDKQASLIKDDLLEPIDELLDDEELVALVQQRLERRHKRSRTRGRRGISPDRLLRCCALKHLKGWSLRELERELRGSLVYRRFTRFDQDAIPNYATFSRSFAVLGDEGTRAIHECIVQKARTERVAQGNKLRTDTTVVESNVHYPTDSSLLEDGIRVVTRALKDISSECAKGVVKVTDHARATKHRVLEIHRAAKVMTDANRERMKNSYGKLLGFTRHVVRQAEKVQSDLKRGRLHIVGKAKVVLAQAARIDHFVPLIKKVISQTKARVFKGDTHVVGKILSLFELHTQAIRKGKAHKPTEFGRLVQVDEVENGIVSNYDIKDGNPADAGAWTPAISQHKAIFGRAPKIATADRGFFSAGNESAAKKSGVDHVAIPAKGPLSEKRKKHQKQRWFRRALRWRAGIEARIGTLKHRFDMVRAHYKGDRGFKRHVGWSIIANNLVSIARVREKRKAEHDAQTKRAA